MNFQMKKTLRVNTVKNENNRFNTEELLSITQKVQENDKSIKFDSLHLINHVKRFCLFLIKKQSYRIQLIELSNK